MTILPNVHTSRQAPELSDAAVEELASIFALLGDATRLRLLRQLRNGPLCVSELVEQLGAKQANVSKQLGVLWSAGLVTRQREGALVRYSLAGSLVVDLCDAVCKKLELDAAATVKAMRSVRRK